MAGQFGGCDRAGGGELVGRPGEELYGLVEDAGGLDVVGKPRCGQRDGAEGRVDAAGPDGGDGRVGVEEVGHDLEFGFRVRAVEAAQQGGRGEPPADHVDAQGAAAGPHGGGGPFCGLEQIAGVRQERLPVSGWLLGLAFIRPGAAGLVLVIAVEFGLITCMGVFNPVFASYRLEQIAADRVARTLSAWSVSSSATIAALTALWGLLAGATSPRMAIAVAGVLMLATPLLLPRRARTLEEQQRELVASV